MKEGWFTAQRLVHYITRQKSDFRQARRYQRHRLCGPDCRLCSCIRWTVEGGWLWRKVTCRPTTTKRLVIGNNIAAWALFVAVAFLASASIGKVAWLLSFVIVGILGWYTGTGNLDLQSLAKVAQARSMVPDAPTEMPEPASYIPGVDAIGAALIVGGLW